MKSIVVLMLAAILLTGMLPEPARADSATDAALALGAFAVFNQLLAGQTVFHNGHVRERVVVVREAPVVYYAPPPPPVVVVPQPYPVTYGYVMSYPVYQNHYYTHYGKPYYKHYNKQHYKHFKKFRKHREHDDD